MIKYSGYSAECDTLEELIKAIGMLPNTIKSIKVQSSLDSFNPNSVKLDWTKDLKSLTKIIIEEAILERPEIFIDKFYLRSYFGPGGGNDPYYISLSSDKSRAFASSMAKGDLGSLD